MDAPGCSAGALPAFVDSLQPPAGLTHQVPGNEGLGLSLSPACGSGSLTTETTPPSSLYEDLLGSESSESRGEEGQDSEFLFANGGLVHGSCVLGVAELLYLGVDCWKPKGSPADTPWASKFYLSLHRKVSLMARVVVPPPLAPP